jgi:ElaB/YqjD/DUF883 family membrane-anchored ribosome-binding protein
MASTTDMAPNRTAANGTTRTRAPATRRPAASRAAPRRAARPDNLETQIETLQNDIKTIASTLATLAEEKVDEARGVAKREVKQAVKAGQGVVDDVQDEFGQLEKQIKDVIREKPLTAVAGAIALGFILAVVSR